MHYYHCVDGVYIIHTGNHCPLQHWTKLQKSGGPWPKERSGHAACCIDYSGENPLLLVSGGVDKGDNVLKDAWLLNVNAATWKEVGWLQCICKGLRHYLCEMQGTVTLVAY